MDSFCSDSARSAPPRRAGHSPPYSKESAMFKNDADRGPLNYSCIGSTIRERNAASAAADAQRWENEGGAAIHERVPQTHVREMAYQSAPFDADHRSDLAGYVPALLAQLKL